MGTNWRPKERRTCKMPLPHKLKVWILIAVAAGGGVALPFIPRISQDPAYHQFADTRAILGIPNFWNVITNLPFLFVGLAGLAVFRAHNQHRIAPGLRLCFAVFLLGVTLVSFGSACYHYAP